MSELFARLLGVAVPVFAVSSMLAVGFGHTVRQVLGPLRDVVGVIGAIIANFVLVPLVAFGVARMISLDAPLAIGLILVASAAGAPFLIKLTAMARDDVAFAAAILVLLLLVTIAYMPVVVPRLSPGAEVNAMAIARPLLLTMLLPLAIGFAVRAFLPVVAARLRPVMGPISTTEMVVIVVCTILGNLRSIVQLFGTGAIVAAFLVIGGAFAVGFIVGTFDRREKVVLGFATAHRNFAAATVVATQSFSDRRVLVMTVIASTMAMVLLLPLARTIGSRRQRSFQKEAG